MKKLLVCFLLITSSLFVSSCSQTTAFEHNLNSVGITKEDLKSRFGPATRIEHRPDGGETWIYRENSPDGSSKVIYYSISKNGTVIRQDFPFE